MKRLFDYCFPASIVFTYMKKSRFRFIPSVESFHCTDGFHMKQRVTCTSSFQWRADRNIRICLCLRLSQLKSNPSDASYHLFCKIQVFPHRLWIRLKHIRISGRDCVLIDNKDTGKIHAVKYTGISPEMIFLHTHNSRILFF